MDSIFVVETCTNIIGCGIYFCCGNIYSNMAHFISCKKIVDALNINSSLNRFFVYMGCHIPFLHIKIVGSLAISLSLCGGRLTHVLSTM